jgi:uncharacterized repeat protein (TIGR01451 family)
MSYETSNRGSALRRTRSVPILIATAGALLALLIMGANTAKADPVSYSFDDGIINLGGSDGTWAKLIDKTIGDPPATLKSEVAGDGALTAAQGDFFFPTKRIEDLDVRDVGQGVLSFVDATIKITAEGPISGNFDTATGESEVTIPADVFVTVYNANSPAFVAKCRIDGFDLVLNTTAETMSDPGNPGDPEGDPPIPARPAADYAASAFDPANDGKGAMIASWEGLPAAKNEGGSLGWAVCPGLDGMLGGPGGAWLDGKAGGDIVVVPQPAPTVAPKITGTPSSSTESTTGAFTFAQGDAETSEVTGFQCKLDGGAFAACDSGSVSYPNLALGSHTFEVKATNAEGEGPVSAPYSWTITEAEGCPDGTSGTPPNCVTVKKPAKLGALKIVPASKSVKPGKKATFTAKVKNVGGKTAKGVKVCVTAPKKLISVKKCVTVGNLAAGKTGTVKFKVTVKKAAKKGKKLALKFKATSNGAGTKSGTGTVKVK